jgi:hypothetical protein
MYIGDGSITYTLVHQCLNNRKHISTTKEPIIVDLNFNALPKCVGQKPQNPSAEL